MPAHCIMQFNALRFRIQAATIPIRIAGIKAQLWNTNRFTRQREKKKKINAKPISRSPMYEQLNDNRLIIRDTRLAHRDKIARLHLTLRNSPTISTSTSQIFAGWRDLKPTFESDLIESNLQVCACINSHLNWKTKHVRNWDSCAAATAKLDKPVKTERKRRWHFYSSYLSFWKTVGKK